MVENGSFSKRPSATACNVNLEGYLLHKRLETINIK